MTIWKYVLEITDVQEIEVPLTATALHIAEQHGQLCMWALVDEDEETEVKRFVIVGTGNPAPRPDQGVHLGSALMHGGSLVWHVFQELPQDSIFRQK